MADKIFTDGLVIIQAKEGQPTWIKMRLSFKVASFVKFLEDNKKADGWVNVDVCESRAGDKLYGVLNTWKPDRKMEAEPVIEYGSKEITEDDLPF